MDNILSDEDGGLPGWPISIRAVAIVYAKVFEGRAVSGFEIGFL